ncbi:gypsy type transposase [Tanacetum coccineum]
MPLDLRTDEAVHKEGVIGIDTSGSPRRQETMGGAPAQTRRLPPGSDEGRLKLEELMAMCTKLSKHVLDLEKEKDAQAMKILKLKKRVESSDDDLDEEDASKQGRKSDKTKPMFKDSDFDRLWYRTTARAEAIRNKPPTKTQVRNMMITYLKHMGKYTHQQLKNKTYEEIQRLYEKEKRWIDDFQPMDTEAIKDSEKNVDSSSKPAGGSRRKHLPEKRAGEKKSKESAKKQKLEDVAKEQELVKSDEEAAADYEHEKEELRMWLIVVSDEEETVDPKILSAKYPIVDWESQNLGNVDMENLHVYKIIRADGNTSYHKSLSSMLRKFDRQDLIDLHRLVMKRFEDTTPEGEVKDAYLGICDSRLRNYSPDHAKNSPGKLENSPGQVENSHINVENSMENYLEQLENSPDHVENSLVHVENSLEKIENSSIQVENSLVHVENSPDISEDPFGNEVVKHVAHESISSPGTIESVPMNMSPSDSKHDHVDSLTPSPKPINGFLSLNASNSKWLATDSYLLFMSVYSPQDMPHKRNLWAYMMGIINCWHGEVVVMGDFNEVRFDSERHGSTFYASNAAEFNTFIINSHLIDVPLGGNSFTWSDKHASKMSKLDRFLVSVGLLALFLNLSGLILCRHISDHKLIILKESHMDYGPTPFRLFYSWFLEQDLPYVVEYSLNNDGVHASNATILFKNKLKSLKLTLKIWSIQKKSIKEHDRIFPRRFSADSSHDLEGDISNDDIKRRGLLIEWSSSNVNVLMMMLHLFFLVFGLKVNMHKSSLYVLDVHSSDIQIMANSFGCLANNLPFTYLNMKVAANVVCINSWNKLLVVGVGPLSGKVPLLSCSRMRITFLGPRAHCDNTAQAQRPVPQGFALPLGLIFLFSTMGYIDSLKSVLTQSALDDLCEKYYIPDAVHPELPGPNSRIRRSPTDKISLSVIAAAKVSHFEILCRVHSFIPTMGNFRSAKSLRKDPPPAPNEFSVEVCDFLADNPAPFKKFPEAFLCLVGISCYYTLDENCYPTFWEDEDEGGCLFLAYFDLLSCFCARLVFLLGVEMDLFAFIRHADPTKVKIGEREIREGEVPLLELTKDRVVPLAGVYDQGDVAAPGVGIEILEDDEAQALVADKPKNLKKRKTADGAGGSGLPLKKLRVDHGTSRDASATTAGKSLAVLQNLLDKITLAAEVGATAAATIPLVTSFVAPIPEHESGEYADSVSAANVRTRRPTKRFVISSDTHDSNANVADDKVSSVVRDVNEATHVSIFADSNYAGNVDPNVAGPSQQSGNDISPESFYVSLDMDSETLRQAYVPRWDLRAMEYDQLLSKFNVGAARQTCLSAEVRMRLKHILRGKKRLEDRCAAATPFPLLLLSLPPYQVHDVVSMLILLSAANVRTRLRTELYYSVYSSVYKTYHCCWLTLMWRGGLNSGVGVVCGWFMRRIMMRGDSGSCCFMGVRKRKMSANEEGEFYCRRGSGLWKGWGENVGKGDLGGDRTVGDDYEGFVVRVVIVLYGKGLIVEGCGHELRIGVVMWEQSLRGEGTEDEWGVNGIG